MEQHLPKQLRLEEEGYWRQMAGSKESEDEEWRGIGWKVTDEQGAYYFRHQEKVCALQWLADHGYRDRGDGTQYGRKVDLVGMVESPDARSALS